MSSALFEIADAIVAELNTATFTSFSFQAERVLVSQVELKALAALRVSVLGVSRVPVPVTRRKTVHRVTVHVCVQQLVSSKNASDVDPLVGLVEEIASFFSRRRMAELPECVVDADAVGEPPYDERHLAERSQFTGLVTIEVADWRG